MTERRKEYTHTFYENNHATLIGGVIFTFLRSAIYILISTSLGIMVDAMINPETELKKYGSFHRLIFEYLVQSL